MNCKSSLFFIIWVVFIFSCNFFHSAFAQDTQLKEKEYYQQWFLSNIGKQVDLDEINNLSPIDLLTIQSIIFEHSNDTLLESRWFGVTLTAQVGSFSDNPEVIKRSISNLVRFLFDADTRIQHAAAQSIENFSPKHFTKTHRDSLLAIIKSIQNPNIITVIVKVAGKLDIREAIPFIKDFTENSKNPFIQRWVSLAALIRMGDSEAEKKMFDFMVKTGYNLDAITMLYPYILYSRSRNNVNHLISAVKNDTSECESSNPNVTTRIPCAYHILKVIGPEIRELNWSGPSGLEMLNPTESIEKARVILKRIENNWTFVGD